jgi:Asp-tRNA(Asn)/Glu-tRNA(Gln) amidotransferase A subunit family amidase
VIDPYEAIEQAQLDAEAVADEVAESSGLDRREFVLMSIAAAAATTLGSAGALAAQGGRGGAAGGAAAGGAAAQQVQQLQMGNGEPVSWTFQAYPGGTGALMEKLAKERGRAAFDRAVFTVEPWRGAVPTSDDDIAFLPAHRLSALLKEKRVTSTKLTQIYLARLKRLNPQLNCVVTLMETQALAEAAQADREIAAGQYRGPLHGLPYGLKDLFSTKGVPTTWGAADFKDRIIDEDAEIVLRLRAAGAVLIAKLSTGLFAQNDWWYGGRTNNPWNLRVGSSGSSAGPGSATPAGCVAFAIGTETQGSIVSPAIRNGLTALRPTYGRVSRHGGMVLAWSMDRVGPMCRSVEDCAMVFNVLHGVDEKDPSTVMAPFQFDRNVNLASLRIGVDPNAPPELVAKLRELGARPVEVGPRPTVPGFGSGLNAEYAAAFDEYVKMKAAQVGLDLNALPEPGRGGGNGGGGRGAAAGAPATPPDPMAPADWNPRFVNGRTIRAFDFVQNQRRRYVLMTKWAEYMKDLDMFIGNPNADIGPNAQTGHPCVVLPYKFDVPNFGGGGGRGGANATPAPALNPQPICAVITGALFADDKILSVAHAFQKATDFHLRRPRL